MHNYLIPLIFVVDHLIIFIVLYSIWYIHTVLLVYCILSYLSKLDVRSLDAVGIGSPSSILESEAIPEAPHEEYWEWSADDIV